MATVDSREGSYESPEKPEVGATPRLRRALKRWYLKRKRRDDDIDNNESVIMKNKRRRLEGPSLPPRPLQDAFSPTAPPATLPLPSVSASEASSSTAVGSARSRSDALPFKPGEHVFRGAHGENIEDFFEFLDAVVRRDPNQKCFVLDHFVEMFRGDALNTYMRLPVDASYEEIKQHMFNVFGSSNDEVALVEERLNLRPESSSPQDLIAYYHRFMRAFNNNDVCEFLARLPSELLRVMRGQVFPTVTDALAVAKRLGANLQLTSVAAPASSSAPFPASSPVVSSPMTSTSAPAPFSPILPSVPVSLVLSPMASPAPAASPAPYKRKFKKVIRRTGTPAATVTPVAHVASSAPATTSIAAPAAAATPRFRTCYLCGDPNHIKRFCPFLNKDQAGKA